MSISFATMAAAPHRQLTASPLNPVAAYAYHHAAAGATTMQVCGAVDGTTLSTATHLSNLERLLQMQKEESHPPTAPCTYPTADVDDAGPNPGPQESPYSSLGSRLLNALNLPSSLFLPRSAKTQAEDMSPCSLNQFRRLLSNSNRASPRGSIASNWRQLHGADDWVGLLDPLDDNLRRELLRFGEFVQATYHAFHSNAVTHDRPRHVILPERSYRVTRNLFATSSVVLPPWVDRVAPWMVGAQPTSWIGYVAVCENEREIRRMGRRDIVIALRGTSTCLEWAENFRTELVPIDDGEEGDEEDDPRVAKVECGFRSLYKTPGENAPSLSEAVLDEVRKLTEEYAGEELSITVVGHSLGAALAVLVADELAAALPPSVATAVFTFGGPRTGNQAFADRVEQRGVKVLRVVNSQDVVTRVPMVLRTKSKGYAHVGRELVVDSRSSPYLRPNAGPACSHDLEAYLHLVDGFKASDGPFRADAKRSLARLLSQQGANMKKLYVNKAQELQLQHAGSGSFRRCNSGQLASPSSTY